MIKDITIIGGGSAGWMTAATLIKAFPNKNITLIESKNTPTVGVGESTLGTIQSWLNFLEIKGEDFLKEVDGIYKLSIKFTDFYKKGESFHYPFGQADLNDNLNGLNDWWYKKFLHPETPYSDYANCFYKNMAYVNNNTFNKELVSVYAFHFDATKLGRWLKNNYCLPKGVKHIVDDVKTVEQYEEGIKSLNNKYKADLYIDCTGFKSLLLGETLEEPFESYADKLPNNSAWATKIPYKNKKKELVPYTNCTAYNNGWIWNIPLWSRIGTGYVYSNKFISDEGALKEFQKYLGTEELDFKKIKMKVGIHRRLWVKNVVAIGLSAGFIEPLESNGLFSVHEFLLNLIRNMDRDHISQWDKDNFTFQCKKVFKSLSEFVALHYALSHRNDTEYWKDNLNKTWCNDLINLKTSLGSDFLKIATDKDERFKFDPRGGIHCVGAGMHYGPTNLNTIKWLEKGHNNSRVDWITAIQNLEHKHKMWDKEAKDQTSLYEIVSNLE